MLVIDEDDSKESTSTAAASKEEIKMRHRRKKNSGDNGRLRPTSIHIFEDLEESGVIPTQKLSSYKAQVRNDRLHRTMQALSSIDSDVAKELFDASDPTARSERPMSMFDFATKGLISPSNDLLAAGVHDNWLQKEVAARCIQRHFRGHLGRKSCAVRLYEAYVAEEEKQRQAFEEETEILVENRRLCLEMDDFDTVQRNAERLLVSKVITIQRAWRAHQAKMVKDLPHFGKSRVPKKIDSKEVFPSSSISCDTIAECVMTETMGSLPKSQDLKKSASEKNLEQSANKKGFDREFIRQRLAMDEDDSRIESVTKKDDLISSRRVFCSDVLPEVTLTHIPECVESPPPDAFSKNTIPRRKDDFDTAHDRLRSETEHQLALATPMAQLQMELEKNEEDTTSVLSNFQGLAAVCGANGFNLREIPYLNLASLQVIVNDLHNRIEGNNEQLVAMLQERDQLHMEQDSMLVDIEDLIKRCKQQAESNNRKGANR